MAAEHRTRPGLGALLLCALLGALAAPPAVARSCAGLDAHERRGGHALARHAGKDEAFLRRRLQAERISAASTFPSAEEADRLVAKALAKSRKRLLGWLRGRSARLSLRVRSDEVTGLSLGREKARAVEVHSVRLVLQRDREMDCGYRLVTAYPEAP